MGNTMGVAKLLFTEIIRPMQKVRGFTPKVVAALMAMGQNMAAECGFEVKDATEVEGAHSQKKDDIYTQL